MSKNKQKNKKFSSKVFNYTATKNGKVFIYWQGKLAKTLKGKESRKFISRIIRSNAEEQQIIMAKTTGNFKRGNERIWNNCTKSWML